MLLARGEGGAANTLPWLVGATVKKGAEFGFWLNVPVRGTVRASKNDGALNACGA